MNFKLEKLVKFLLEELNNDLKKVSVVLHLKIKTWWLIRVEFIAAPLNN